MYFRGKIYKKNVNECNDCKPGILSSLHLAGNHLNFNPYVHATDTRDLVDTKSGEITEIHFMPYKTMRQ